jgi:hypothetical protein
MFPSCRRAPKGRKFNVSYDLNIIIQSILEGRSNGTEPGRGLISDAENARFHTDENSLRFCCKDGLEMVPHRSYSPNLAPFDFFLFAHVKRNSEETLMAVIQSVVSDLTVET